MEIGKSLHKVPIIRIDKDFFGPTIVSLNSTIPEDKRFLKLLSKEEKKSGKGREKKQYPIYDITVYQVTILRA